MSATYHRTEKLKSRKTLQGLFTSGRSFNVFPVKVFYVIGEKADMPVQAGVGVSSRHFKKAVDRNRIKRLLRESYRLNKTSLHETLLKKERSLSVFFLYLGKELPEYLPLEEKMRSAIHKLEEQLA